MQARTPNEPDRALAPHRVVLVHGLGLLCALGAAVLAAAVARRRDAVAMAAGFGATALWLPPEPGVVGTAVAVVAVAVLARPGRVRLVAAAAAGLLAGAWTHVLAAHGFARWSAWLLAAAVVVVSVVAARRNPRFAPRAIREEALAVLALGALIVAAAPAVAAGWSAAEAMNLTAGDVSRSAVHPAVLAVLGAVVALGGAHALRRRQ